IAEYPQSLFHTVDYVPQGMGGHVNIVPPAIDPLAPKNMALSPEDAAYVCDQFGLDVDRPLMCQVSRFDPWKDPLGVIDAYRIVKEALWKARPFIGGNVGGIPLQVENGISGYLVSDVETCAARSLDILRDPALGKALGRRGKEHVRKHFLTPRYLRDYLRIFGEL